ncbi:MAG: flagellar motor stator protein MotA [Pseudomonadota bacterium]|nr:flagellar motor stator protein MotA [Pseudomonadota bacterium]
MPQLIGLVLIVVLVMGGLILTGGKGALQALPFEMALIGGAAIGTLLLGNSPKVAREAFSGFVRSFRGSRWQRAQHRELLVLLATLMRQARQGGFVAIETDIEHPENSAVFAAAPAVTADAAVRDMICDSFRLMALDLSDPARAEAHMEQSVATHVDQRMKAVNALNTVADALPALGIVAAVLGIIKTMGSIDESPAILGMMIGSALLGTFLGVFLAYGVVGPVAARFGQIVEDEAQPLDVIRTVLSAFGSGVQPGIAVELGRTAIPADQRPDADSVERAQTSARFVHRAVA